MIDTDRLRAAIDIVEVIGARITLRKAGIDYLGACPFHDEKTPSFTVSRAKQFYHCFGCGQHGDVIDFLQRYESLDFRGACYLLAGVAGIDLHRDEDTDPAAILRAARADRVAQIRQIEERLIVELIVLEVAFLGNAFCADENPVAVRDRVARACSSIWYGLQWIYPVRSWEAQEGAAWSSLSIETAIVRHALQGRFRERVDGHNLRELQPWRIPFPTESACREQDAAYRVWRVLDDLKTAWMEEKKI